MYCFRNVDTEKKALSIITYLFELNIWLEIFVDVYEALVHLMYYAARISSLPNRVG